MADVLVPEQLQDPLGLHVQGLHRPQQRRLLVERLAGPAHEGRGNAERRAVGVFQDVGRAGRVPGRVAAGLERGADAARGEARRVGLALDQLLAGELGDCAARRRRARGSCRASRRSGRSADRTRGRSASPPSRWPSPSWPWRRRRRRVGSSLAPDSIVFFSDLKTGLGSRFCISLSEKTFAPNTSCDDSSLKFSGGAAGLVIGNGRDGLQTSCTATHGTTTPTLKRLETEIRTAEPSSANRLLRKHAMCQTCSQPRSDRRPIAEVVSARRLASQRRERRQRRLQSQLACIRGHACPTCRRTHLSSRHNYAIVNPNAAQFVQDAAHVVAARASTLLANCSPAA